MFIVMVWSLFLQDLSVLNHFKIIFRNLSTAVIYGGVGWSEYDSVHVVYTLYKCLTSWCLQVFGHVVITFVYTFTCTLLIIYYYDEEFAYLRCGCDYCSCRGYCFCLIVFTYMYQLYRTHAGIDEMDIFFNIDLNNFLDVSIYI